MVGVNYWLYLIRYYFVILKAGAKNPAGRSAVNTQWGYIDATGFDFEVGTVTHLRLMLYI